MYICEKACGTSSVVTYDLIFPIVSRFNGYLQITKTIVGVHCMGRLQRYLGPFPFAPGGCIVWFWRVGCSVDMGQESKRPINEILTVTL